MWLTSYEDRSRVGTVKRQGFHSSLPRNKILLLGYRKVRKKFWILGCVTILDRLKEYNVLVMDVEPFIETVDKTKHQ